MTDGQNALIVPDAITGERSNDTTPAKRVSRVLGMLSSLEVKVLCPT